MSFVPGPIPAYSNVPINADFYNPSQFAISNITLGQTTIVSSSSNMNYVVGQLVRLLIPLSFGCRQLNEKQGYVISIPSATSVEITIDSSINVDPYIASSSNTPAQILPIGDVNSGIISSTGRNVPTTNIPGSFINVS